MIFSLYMHGEDRMLSPVEPTGFLKFVPILRSVVIDNMMYAVTHMKQTAMLASFTSKLKSMLLKLLSDLDMLALNYLSLRNISADKVADLDMEKVCNILS